MNEIYGRIYCITNQINGKVYIGQTTKTIEERLQAHFKNLKHRNYYLYAAINKYGKENFSIKEIDIAYDKKELNEKEIKYIIDYDSFCHEKGYNMTSGGEGGIPNEEIRRKLSESKKGNKNPMYGRKGENNYSYGTHLKEETKNKISASLKGRFLPIETCNKMSESRKGKNNPMFGKIGINNHCSVKVKCIETEEEFDSMRDVQKKYGYCETGISMCCRGIRKTCGGYHWQYV